MADAYFEIEEYLWFDETIQGNVNVAGLVFDDLIEETIDLGPEEVLTVYSDVLEETLAFADDPRYVRGLHYTAVSDWIDFQEAFGPPLRVRQSVLNLIMTTPVTPALIANVHLDVLHGVDIYWEEVSDELIIDCTYANAVPYWWEWIYESLDIDMTEPQPLPPVFLVLNLLSTDLVNMMHDLVQEYYFNSTCFEEFFVWDDYAWGWDHLVDESLVYTDTMQEIIGKVADDYIYLGEDLVPKVTVLHLVEDMVFAFDAGTHEKYYLLQADEALVIEDGEVSFASITPLDTIEESLDIAEMAIGEGVFIKLASESLVFADISAFIHDLIIEEGIDLGDVDLERWVFNVLVECGCDIADIIG